MKPEVPAALPSPDDANLKRVVEWVVNLGSFLTPFSAASLNVGLPAMGKELHMGAATLGWVATAYLLAAAVFVLPFGRIADIHGRRRVLLYGYVVFTLAALASVFAPSASVLIGLRVVQGVGGAMMFATAPAILTSVFPPGERGRVLGRNVMAVYMGLALGPFVGGFVTQHGGWRALFAVNFLVGLLMVLTMLTKLHAEWADARGEAFDSVGAVIYGVMLVGIMYGFTRLPSSSGLALVSGGLVALVAFVVWESRNASPVLRVSLFRANPVFALSSLAALIHYCATFAVGFVLSLFFQSTQGLTPQRAGVLLVAQPVMMALFSPLAGRLSDRIEPRILASAGMGITTVGVFFLSFLGPHTSQILIVADLLLLGFGFALFSSPNANAIMSSLEKRHLGIGSGMLGTVRLLGQNLSLGIMTMVLGVSMGNQALSAATQPQFLRSTHVVFLIFTGLGIVGALASLARGRVR